MANMSYCAFRNTSLDLSQCLRILKEEKENLNEAWFGAIWAVIVAIGIARPVYHCWQRIGDANTKFENQEISFRYNVPPKNEEYVNVGEGFEILPISKIISPEISSFVE